MGCSTGAEWFSDYFERFERFGAFSSFGKELSFYAVFERLERFGAFSSFRSPQLTGCSSPAVNDCTYRESAVLQELSGFMPFLSIWGDLERFLHLGHHSLLGAAVQLKTPALIESGLFYKS